MWEFCCCFETIVNYAVTCFRKRNNKKLCSAKYFPFPKEHVRMHDSLASNHERGRSGMVWELKMVYEEEN